MKLQAVKVKNALASFPQQTALIVGATSGIGEAIAYRLARAQFSVVIAGRNKTRGNQVVEGLQAVNPKGEHGFVPLDAQLISNIHGISTKVPPIDKLVLTQGIATIQGHTPTSEGIDQKLALHYYGRMALIREFLPVLQQSKHSPRVLSIFSGGIHSAYNQFHEDPELKKNYTLKNAADAAGYYNDLMLDAWSEKADNSGIAFAHSAPGVVATNWGTEMPWAIRLLLKPLKAFFAKSPDDCAEFMSDFLLDPAVTPGKFYLIDQYGEPAKTTSAHTDDAKAFIAQHTLDRIDSILKAKTRASQ